MYACLGISWLGMCSYNPSAPSPVYFSLGEAIGALAFTLAVQQLLKPVYRFRLFARHIRPSHLYMLVFAGAAATAVGAVVPIFSALHRGPWGYPIVWELLGATLFAAAYGAVVFSMVVPVRVRKKRIEDFARGVAGILAAADETDHVDIVGDIQWSLPTLIELGSFADTLRDTSAFFDFIHREEINQA